MEDIPLEIIYHIITFLDEIPWNLMNLNKYFYNIIKNVIYDKKILDIIEHNFNKKYLDFITSLKHFDIVYNNIKNFKYNIFKTFYIREIRFENEKSLKVNINVIPTLYNCQFLYINNCNIKEIEHLPKCKFLNIRNCKIEKIGNIKNVTYLLCSNNKLKDIPYMENCKYIDFNNN